VRHVPEAKPADHLAETEGTKLLELLTNMPHDSQFTAGSRLFGSCGFRRAPFRARARCPPHNHNKYSPDEGLKLWFPPAREAPALRDEFIEPEKLRIRSEKFAAIGRMAAPHWYCRTRDRFEMIRPD